MKYFIFVSLILSGCYDPCVDAEFITSGVCVMPADGGPQLEPEHVDLTVAVLEKHLQLMTEDNVDLVQTFSGMRINVTSVHEFHDALYVDQEYVRGVNYGLDTIYMAPIGNDPHTYWILTHELMHTVVPRVLGMSQAENKAHMNPHIWVDWWWSNPRENGKYDDVLEVAASYEIASNLAE